MSEHSPTSIFWRVPVGFGLLLLCASVAAAVGLGAADLHPLWIAPVALGLLFALASAASRVHRRSYLRQLCEHVDRIPLTGEHGPSLTDVYIDLAAQPVDGRDTAERPVVGTGRSTDRRPSLLRLMRSRRRGPIVLLGEAGSGKTTVLHRSVLELARYRLGKRRLPVLIELGSHTSRLAGSQAPDLADLAAEAEWMDRRVPAPWIARQLSAGRCVVMFDGLDEAASQSQRRAVADWIEKQRKRYRRSSFVVTTRPDGLTPDPLSHARHWQLRHLTDSQIAAFLHDWCEAIETRKHGRRQGWVSDAAAAEAGVLLSRLRTVPALHELCAHPLPLTLIALVHRYCGVLPENREALYSEAVEMLVNGDGDLARALARRGMDKKSRHLTIADIRAVDPEADAEEVLANGLHAGWLIRTAESGFAFTHLSLQQFLAERGMPEEEILARIDDPWWRDAILLWSARANVTRVIDACLASGSVAALALAFDAAESAGELAPETLDELRELLTLATKSPDENRLVSAVKVSRELSDMTPLFGGARLATRPVSNSLYSSFLEAEFPAGRPPPDASEQSAAVGIWPSEVRRFLGWINGLPRQDDTRFRLPTEAELSAPQCDPDVQGHSLWIDGGGDEPRLLRTDGSNDPYTVDRDWWERICVADRRRVALSLYQLAMVLGASGRPLSKDMAGELELDRSRAFELPDELKKDTELVKSRAALKKLRPNLGAADAAARAHLERVIDLLAELQAKALDFQGDTGDAEQATVPFTFPDRLTTEQRHLTATAVTLLWFCSPPLTGKQPYGATLAHFGRYWQGDIVDAAERRSRTVRPERLLSVLRETEELLGDDAGDTVWQGLGRGLLARVTDRLETTLSHNTSYTVDDVACARIAVTAVAAVVAAHPSPGPVLEELSTVLAGLTILEDRATGRITPNEALLLVRA